MPTVRFRVTGLVQGVGFRFFVVRTAVSLGLCGEVWNCYDGTVEGLVTGGSFDEFLSQLESGPGQVDSVSQEPAPDQEFDTFSVGLSR